jgi:polyvinyl alcohol dehydrogenase (cytochrome)
MRVRVALVGLGATALLVAGCSGPPANQPAGSSAAPTTAGSAAPGAAADWPTYHRDNARTGFAPDVPPVGTPAVAWRAPLDGAVYGQPLVVGDEVLAGTEGDSVYGLDAATGKVRWRVRLGTPVPTSALPCGDINPLGITGTMAYDAATGRVFAVAETTGGVHTLVGVDVRTGQVDVRVPVPPPHGQQIAHQQRSALTVLDNRVYVAYGGLAGDCGPYVGSVVSVTTAGADLISYAVPTPREGGNWAPGGAAVTGGKLFYAVGNGESSSGYDGSDSVFALTTDLHRADLFAPSTWPQDNQQDLDLGSATPTLLGPWVIAVGKRGTAYVLRAGHLGGIGGQVSQLDLCKSFGGSAVDGSTAYLPCPDGTRAVQVDGAGKLTVRWKSAVPANGSPVVGGGAVWVVDYSTGTLYALDPATGQPKAHLDLGPTPHFTSPTLTPQRAYVGTMAGVTAVSGV